MNGQHFTLISTLDLHRLEAKLDQMAKQLQRLQEHASGGPEWLNRTDAAAMLGVTARTLLKYEKANQWITAHYDQHGRPRFRREEVQDLFRRRATFRGKKR